MIPIDAISNAVLAFPLRPFDWNGGDPDDAIGDLNEDYVDEFGQIDSVACVAYIICCSEWIYYFVRDRLGSKEAINYEQFIVANWFWVCDLPRKAPPQFYEEKTLKSQGKSVYNDAVEVALESITNGIASVPDAETAIDAAFVTQLCEYVLPRECGFGDWRDIVVQRLTEELPAGTKHYDFVQVSRRTFDTDVDLDDVDHEADCASLLGDGDIEGNRYLPLTEPELD